MVKLRPSKQVAPYYMPYLCTLLYLVDIVVILVAIICLIDKRIADSAVGFGVVVFSFIVLFIFSKILSWYKYADLSISNDFVIYSVKDIINVLGKDITKYHIIRLDSYKVKNKDLIIKGYIDMFEPLCKPKHINKLVIRDITDEGLKLIIKFFNK